MLAPRSEDLFCRDAKSILQRGEPVPEVEVDFCGQKRLGATDLGAIEYTAGSFDPASRIPARTAAK